MDSFNSLNHDLRLFPGLTTTCCNRFKCCQPQQRSLLHPPNENSKERIVTLIWVLLKVYVSRMRSSIVWISAGYENYIWASSSVSSLLPKSHHRPKRMLPWEFLSSQQCCRPLLPFQFHHSSWCHQCQLFQHKVKKLLAATSL